MKLQSSKAKSLLKKQRNLFIMQFSMINKNGHQTKATIFIMLICQQIIRRLATEKVRKIKVSKPLLS